MRIVFFAGDENLAAVRHVLRENAAKKPFLLHVLPPPAVVITERHDKLLFPERLRIIPVLDDGALEILPMLAGRYPVYWYGLTPGAEERGVLYSRLAAVGFEMIALDTPFDSESLYRLIYVR